MHHDLFTLRKAAQLAEGSYSTIEGAKKYENKRTDTTAFILKSPDTDYIVWRGTESKLDWISNLLFLPIPVRKAWIHLGFYRAQQGVWKKIRKDLNPAKKTIHIGHSLGGACAEISCHLSREFRNLHLYTLGKPNTFSRLKKCRMDHLKSHYSLVHGSDLVTRLPRFGYRPSTGNNLIQLWFSNAGEDFINPEPHLKKTDWAARDSVSDHFMTGYRDRLDKFCTRCINEEQNNGYRQKLDPKSRKEKGRPAKKRRSKKRTKNPSKEA